MANYSTPDTMARIADLERRMLQLEVSPRLSLYNTASNSSKPGDSLITSVENEWSDFTTATVSVTLETAERALVIFSGRPRIIIGVSSFSRIDLGFDVTNVDTGSYIPPDDPTIAARTLVVNLFAGGFIPGSDSTLTQVVVQNDLTPGQNTFTLKGRYVSPTADVAKPTVIDRSLIVIPLDT